MSQQSPFPTDGSEAICRAGKRKSKIVINTAVPLLASKAFKLSELKVPTLGCKGHKGKEGEDQPASEDTQVDNTEQARSNTLENENDGAGSGDGKVRSGSKTSENGNDETGSISTFDLENCKPKAKTKANDDLLSDLNSDSEKKGNEDTDVCKKTKAKANDDDDDDDDDDDNLLSDFDFDLEESGNKGTNESKKTKAKGKAKAIFLSDTDSDDDDQLEKSTTVQNVTKGSCVYDVTEESRANGKKVKKKKKMGNSFRAQVDKTGSNGPSKGAKKKSKSKGSPGKSMKALLKSKCQNEDGTCWVDKVVRVFYDKDAQEKKVVILWADGQQSVEPFEPPYDNLTEVVREHKK